MDFIFISYFTQYTYSNNNIYNVQNQNVYTTTTKTIHIHTKRKEENKKQLQQQHSIYGSISPQGPRSKFSSGGA